MLSNLPPGVTDADIEYQANGDYDYTPADAATLGATEAELDAALARIPVYITPGTVGCYGWDAEGRSYATYSTQDSDLTCALCGTALPTGGVQRITGGPNGGIEMLCIEHTAWQRRAAV